MASIASSLAALLGFMVRLSASALIWVMFFFVFFLNTVNLDQITVTGEKMKALNRSPDDLMLKCGLLETFLRGGRGAVALGQRGHAARALQAGLERPLVRRLQRVVEGVGLGWEVVPQAPVGSERGEEQEEEEENKRTKGSELWYPTMRLILKRKITD